MEAAIRYCLRNPLVPVLLAVGLVLAGWHAWRTKSIDAIPDISQNQVVVIAEWAGRAPTDIEDQITYPLSVELSSVRGVREVRSASGFGVGEVYVVFDEPIRLLPRSQVRDFYDARTRVLEKLATLQDRLPAGVLAELGPDATALGQILYYTLEGPYDLDRLRAEQDFTVRPLLQSVAGVAEVAGVGGRLREIEVQLDPVRLRHYGVGTLDVVRALRAANLDVGARSLESAGAEAIVRGAGFVRRLEDVERTPVGFATVNGFVPVSMGGEAGRIESERAAGLEPMDAEGVFSLPDERLRPGRVLTIADLGRVEFGPGFLRGTLADGQGERTGGVVTMRFGANPLVVLDGLRSEISRLNDPASGLLPPGMRVRPFYDRGRLIEETQATLERALVQEVAITVLVVLAFLLHLRASFIVASTLPLAVLFSLACMHLLGVDSNLMSLMGIAIAIGTVVDLGVVMCENIYRRLEEELGSRPIERILEDAAVEVGPALFTAVMTTVVSFLPIFFLSETEGKLFRPLAWTKTFALVGAALTGVLLVPVLCKLMLLNAEERQRAGLAGAARLGRLLRSAAGVVAVLGVAWLGARIAPFGLRPAVSALIAAAACWWVLDQMAKQRLVPIDESPVSRAIWSLYRPGLTWALDNKGKFLLFPGAVVLAGVVAALGGERLAGPLVALFGPKVGELRPVVWLAERVPGLGTEFMPPLDEGDLLYMPSLLPQASAGTTLEVMQRQNLLFEAVPEVARVVGKLGRAESALDPAPIGMIETVIALRPRSEWRPGMTRRALLAELEALAHTPGVLEGRGAWLQPIETRVIMLNSGLRAPLAIRIQGSPRDEAGGQLPLADALAQLERVGAQIRDRLREVPGVAGPIVENLGGKPYVEWVFDRERAGSLGVDLAEALETLEAVAGTADAGRSYEGRQRFALRTVWQREMRDTPGALASAWVPGAGGAPVPLGRIAELQHTTGPAMVKTEDGMLRLYVTFAADGRDEGSAMVAALQELDRWRAEERSAGRPDPLPAGLSLSPAGRYEAQARARARFGILIPVAVGVILFLLYTRFRSLAVSLNVFAALPVAAAGGLLALVFWPTCVDLLFAMGVFPEPSAGPVHVTVAVLVGFIALAGIAVDDGVVLATYLEQTRRARPTQTVAQIRSAVLEAGLRRIRPCLMTTATTLLALTPILFSTGRGSDVAIPMALPVVGGMLASLTALFVVPVIYAWGLEAGRGHGEQMPNR